MPISDRINSWVEDRRKVWGGALGDFLLSSIAKGTTKTLEDMEPGAIDGIKAQLLKVRENPNCPDDLKALIDKVITPGNPLIVVIGVAILLLTMLGTLNALMAPLNRAIEYKVDRGVESFRMDPASIITAWRRDPEKYAWLFGDLEEQGWSEKKIEALKFYTEVIPQAQDIIRFALREVYSPEIAEKYGQFQDIPTAAYGDAARAGLPKDTFDKFWAAHWYLPSSSDGFEMLHRGIITQDELKALLKANDIMPYWRDQLIKISWNIPTRVDVRRFWDMRTIDEARLREVYTAIGYHGKDLDDYVLWTKIYTDFPDLLARYKNGWITLDQVKSELVAMGMKPERADTMIEEKIKKAAPERTADELKLTLSDIYKGVKQNKISREEGVELIQYLGSTEPEARFKLDVNVPPDEEDKAEKERLLSKADILSGMKAGVISPEEARPKLLALRYSSANVDLILKIFDAQVKPPTEPKLKEASKADILLGVKKGIITPEEGYGLLLAIDFSPEASGFILMVHAEESPFSPMNFTEFVDRTQKWRLATGLEGKPMNEEIRKAAAEVIRLTGERDSLQQSISREQRGLIGEELLPAEATAQLKKLQSSLRKAEAALSAAKTEYNRLVAEGKYA